MTVTPVVSKAAFIAAFAINRRVIKWRTTRQRTSHMVSHIYRTIADYLDLSIEYEHNFIDAVFYPRDDPEVTENRTLVAMEHENNANTAYLELQKLCRANYPLNVLVTYVWDGTTGEVITNPHFRTNWFAERFGSLLASKSSIGAFMIIVATTDSQVSEPEWSFYIYRQGQYDLV